MVVGRSPANPSFPGRSDLFLPSRGTTALPRDGAGQASTQRARCIRCRGTRISASFRKSTNRATRITVGTALRVQPAGNDVRLQGTGEAQEPVPMNLPARRRLWPRGLRCRITRADFRDASNRANDRVIRDRCRIVDARLARDGIRGHARTILNVNPACLCPSSSACRRTRTASCSRRRTPPMPRAISFNVIHASPTAVRVRELARRGHDLLAQHHEAAVALAARGSA